MTSGTETPGSQARLDEPARGAGDGHPDRPPPSPVGELVLIVAMYGVYSLIRNTFGSASVDPEAAYDNALRVIDVEKALGIYHERAIQQAFIDHDWFIRMWNIFYGSFHFIVPIAVLVLLWTRSGRAYRLWRNTVVATTLLGLIGFSTFPLMPPRLLCECEYGSGVPHGYVDTLATLGGLWSFDSGGMAAISNQYAAMPSLHVAWALWCAAAAMAVARTRWVRVAVWAYPVATTFAVVVTANHYFLDAVGGAAVLVVGYGIARVVEAVGDRRRSHAGPVATGGDSPRIVTGLQHGATVERSPHETSGNP